MRRAVAWVSCALLLLTLVVSATVSATVVGPAPAAAATISTPLAVPEPL